MRSRSPFLIFLIFILTCVELEAAPPDKTAVPASTEIRALDYQSYTNANSVLAFASNVGNLFYDAGKLFGKNDGFYYPFTSIADINSGANRKTMVFDAGLWIGEKIGGETRVSVAEYSTQFVPGPMANTTFQPDNPSFRVYKLYRDSMGTNPNQDYLQWPVTQGAPVDGHGKPLLLGDQTLWTVYNDADPSRHTNNRAGSLGSLGVEVQQTVWQYNVSGKTNMVYVKYKLYNNGQQSIDSLYTSFWADPDIGKPSTDLVGCDTVRNLFFGYKGVDYDTIYAPQLPAWGGRLLQGLVAPAVGYFADFDGHPRFNYRNLPMTAFGKYINGTDPRDSTESYNYMRGLNRDGTPYTFEGVPTKFVHSGNPIAGVGDLDFAPSDRRMLVTCGPVTFLPGDSQQLVFEFAAVQAGDRLSALAQLERTLAPVSCCYGQTGDIDEDGYITLQDLADLVSYFTLTASPRCFESANIDGSSIIDMRDLSALVKYLISPVGAVTLPPCPAF